MSKKLNFVYDEKSGDILAPRIVANHVVAIRDYQMMSSDKDAIFNKFPQDFLLVTCEVGAVIDDSESFAGLAVGDKVSCTSFTEIVGDVNGK